MKIGFILPVCMGKPSGGSKVVFQYANYLAESLGHTVTIYFDAVNLLYKYKLPNKIQRIGARILVYVRPRWFKLHPSIKKKALFEINNQTVMDGDIIIATGVPTAFPIAALDVSKGKKYYFIQGYENWVRSDEYVCSTYRLGMKNIVIAKWLAEIVNKETGIYPEYVGNGIDTDIFRVNNELDKRKKHTIAMQYRKEEIKGCDYAFKTIELLESKYRDLQVIVFSPDPKPSNLPKSCKYVCNASQKEVAQINNSVQVFICSSIEEGFGLPGLEAMACGCALVSTEYKGVLEYAQNKYNALLSPVKDSTAMKDNIEMLFEDESLRLRIANNALNTVKERSLKVAAENFARVLQE
jgi:glycosyltransferase involved in cell wall biosynthesis